MQIRILNLNDLRETLLDIIDVDFENTDGAKSVPYVIKWQLSKQRLGTAKTKLMSEISGTTRKSIKQKGSGGARHGSRRAVQFVGGRTCFGPQPRDYSFSIPKKIVKKALGFILRDKIVNNKVILIEGMGDLGISTSKLRKTLKEKGINKALIAYNEEYDNFMMSLRNLFEYKALPQVALNVYDIVNYDYLLIDRQAFEKIKEVM